MSDYFKTKINITGCVFNAKGVMDLITNSVDGKQIFKNVLQFGDIR
jgi:hypothetical protein